MKNKKGFISISLVYSFLLVFIGMIIALLANYEHNRILVDNISGNIQEFLDTYNVIGAGAEDQIEEFLFTGSPQEFTAKNNGYYRVTLNGAGGMSGGMGGRTTGIIKLNIDSKLYVYVGGAGLQANNALSGWNGGNPAGSARTTAMAGGGATDIRLQNGVWNDVTSLNSRIMVAGGGGGRALGGTRSYNNGGGLYGGIGESQTIGSPYYTGGAGGTQKSGGTFGNGNGSQVGATAGGFGYGGYGTNTYGGQGGGGYYGGGGAGFSPANFGQGGGGSSYISGYSGVNSKAASGTHNFETKHFSGNYFYATKMEVGVNNGNGSAVIEYIGERLPVKNNYDLEQVRYIKSCINGTSSDVKNYWTEIQAIKDGVNIAKGKVPTGVNGAAITNAALITDGEIDKTNFATSSVASSCVLIDLGEPDDLDEIALWLKWDENQMFRNNVLSVSDDNTDWTDLHSHTTTGYMETSEGRRYTAWNY